MNAHLDVVPAKSNQFLPKIVGNRLVGRGACDMKASAAVMIYLFLDISNKVNYPLGLQLVTDEETGGYNGAKYQLEQGIRADFVITGEPTDLEIVIKSKGTFSLFIKASGTNAHSATPWEGRNALSSLVDYIQILQKKFPTPIQEAWKTTCSLMWITTTNKTGNVIPDQAEAKMDIRYIPKSFSANEKEIIDFFQNLQLKK